jgi:hypothetical protein
MKMSIYIFTRGVIQDILDAEVLNGNIKTNSVAGGQGSSQPEDPEAGPWAHCFGSCPSSEKEEVITGQPRATGLGVPGGGFVGEEYFIEREEDGGRYRVLKPNADRASVVTDTQAEAIAWVKETHPNAALHVERVREVGPGRDKWRHIP